MEPVSADSLRERGNKWFHRAQQASEDSQRKECLTTARDLYIKSLEKARSPDELASAYKNLGLTWSQLAQLTPPGADRTDRLRQSVLCKCRAYGYGQPAKKSNQWLLSIWDSIATLINEYIDDAVADVTESSSNIGAALQRLQQLQAVLPLDFYQGRVKATLRFLEGVESVAAALINAAAGARGSADWHSCLKLVADVNRPLMEALQMAVDKQDSAGVEALQGVEDKLFVMQCRCQSAQARLQGDDMLQRALEQAMRKSSKHLRSSTIKAATLDGVLAAVDLYRKSALLARERDLQAEAQAVSRLGHVYKVCSSVLDRSLLSSRSGLPATMLRCAADRSREAYLKVLLLVDAIPHRINLMMEDWYREARDAISEYQRSSAARDEQQQEADKAMIREALKDELRALWNAADKGWAELLKHCYDKHPPLNPAHRLAPDTDFTADNGKELLRKAIVAYHPDKQAQGLSQWQVLAEEITKSLTRKYEYFK